MTAAGTGVLAGLREAAAEDAAAVRDLVRAAYARYVPRMGREPATMLADYAEAVRRHRLRLLPDADGRLAAVLETVDRGDHLYVENIAVRPDLQGRGIGAALLALAEAEARGLGRPETRLCTNETMVENLAWYARAGYREVRRWPYRGTDVVDLAKRL
ncbi:MAG TPA: GNAT family N-acetyltransferase [Azospirillaceae bacterium]|nr:GNAT family N-acetyltransferase [Azospirillaceae bacterium]